MALVSGEGGGITFSGFTRLSKGLAAVFVLGFTLASLLPWTVEYLALVPGRTIPFAWNLLSASYLEQTLLGLISSVVGVLFFGKLLEPIWGPRGFVKFIVFVSFFTSISTFIVMIFLYYVTSQGRYLYLPISGFSGVLAGFVVAVKQLMPDQEFFSLKLRAKWFPSLCVVLALIVGLLAPNAISFLPNVLLGTFISWIYLRYFQSKSEAKNVKGDSSEEFAFSTFFPPFMRPIVHPISVVCEKLFCGRRPESSSLAEDEEQGIGGRPLPGSDPIEASRRRERGARALEERLTASNDNVGSEKPTTPESNV